MGEPMGVRQEKSRIEVLENENYQLKLKISLLERKYHEAVARQAGPAPSSSTETTALQARLDASEKERAKLLQKTERIEKRVASEVERVRQFYQGQVNEFKQRDRARQDSRNNKDKEELSKLQEINTTLRKNILALQQENHELGMARSRDIEQLQTQIQLLQGQLRDARQYANSAGAASTSAGDQMRAHDVQAHNAQAQARQQALAEAEQQHQHQQQKLLDRITRLELELAKPSDTARLQAQLSSMQKALDETTQRLETAQDELRRAKQVAEQREQNMNDKIAYLKETNVDQLAVATLESRAREAELKVQKLQLEIQATESEARRFRVNNEILKSEMAQLKSATGPVRPMSSVRKREEEIKAMKVKLGREMGERERLQHLLEDRQIVIEVLEKRNEELEETLKQTSTVAAHSPKVEELQEQAAALRQRLMQLELDSEQQLQDLKREATEAHFKEVDRLRMLHEAQINELQAKLMSSSLHFGSSAAETEAV